MAAATWVSNEPALQSTAVHCSFLFNQLSIVHAAGFDTALHPSHITDEEDSAFPALADREFHLLHRNIPALRRTGVDTTRIRQVSRPGQPARPITALTACQSE